MPASDPHKKEFDSGLPIGGPHLTIDRRSPGVGVNANILRCVEEAMARYFRYLDGQTPVDVYRMVMGQVEFALIRIIMAECGNNQSRAAEYPGISRGSLRNK